MRILVTGSSGRIGTAVARAVRARHRVTGVDRLAGQQTDAVGDLRHPTLADRLCAGMDAVVHVAALHAPHVGRVDEADFRQTNIEVTRRLLEACRRHDVGRFVLTSSTSVYGHALVDPARAVWVTEDLAPQPRDIYDQTKLAAEDLCRQFAVGGRVAVALRMSRCFPEPERLMAIYRLYRGVDAQDVADAHLRALTRPATGFELFNVSATTPFDEQDTQALRNDADAVIRRRVPWAAAAFAERGWALPASIDRVYVCDKARCLLGWEPVRNFASLFGRQDSLQ